jgi:hypothetical protein
MDVLENLAMYDRTMSSFYSRCLSLGLQVTIGDPYKVQDPKKQFNEKAVKGKQMMTTVPKTKSALPAGFFEPAFKRVMEVG